MRSLLAFVLLVTACSNATSTNDAGPGNDGSAPVACPSVAPTDGADCSGMGSCEWGGDAHGRCTTLGSCYGGKWHITAPTNCGNVKECPQTYAGLAEGSTCPLPNGGTCYYDEGGCGCMPCQAEGGAQATQWKCRPWSSAGAGCPSPRPLLGTKCTMENQVCDYSGCCNVSLGSAQACQNGVWSGAVQVGCSCALQPCK
jgi:hypothetical protein